MTAADEDRALLKAVCDQPDDDTPRLVYADWLQEHGHDERAEFIRAQCALARIEGDDPRRPTLARREAELHAAHGAKWATPLPPGVLAPRFRRGFVAGVTLTAGAFAQYAGELFALHPVTSVWLPGDRHMRALARSPHLSRVRDLGAHDADTGALTAVIGSQFATGLRGLYAERLGAFSGVQRLADYFPLLADPRLAGLTRLGLYFNNLNAAEAEQFVRLKLMPHLTELTLVADTIGDTTLRALAKSPAVAELRVLRLRASDLTDAGIRRLAASPHLTYLRRLTLFGARAVTSEGFAALAESPHLQNLTDLDLRYTAVTAADVQTLLALPRLSRLVLNCTPAAGSEPLAEQGRWNECPPDHGPGVVWASELRGE